MQLRRRHYFITGLVLLLIGAQLRVVEGYVLNDTATRFLAEHFGEPPTTAEGAVQRAYLATGAPASYTVEPPRWIGYAMLSVGFVLTICFWPPLRR
jgi:hypothetical protein